MNKFQNMTADEKTAWIENMHRQDKARRVREANTPAILHIERTEGSDKVSALARAAGGDCPTAADLAKEERLRQCAK